MRCRTNTSMITHHEKNRRNQKIWSAANYVGLFNRFKNGQNATKSQPQTGRRPVVGAKPPATSPQRAASTELVNLIVICEG